MNLPRPNPMAKPALASRQGECAVGGDVAAVHARALGREAQRGSGSERSSARGSERGSDGMFVGGIDRTPAMPGRDAGLYRVDLLDLPADVISQPVLPSDSPSSVRPFTDNRSTVS